MAEGKIAMTEQARRVAEGLSEAQRAALLGAHRLSDFSDERAIHHLCSQRTLKALWNKGLIRGSRYVSVLGLAVRQHLLSREKQ